MPAVIWTTSADKTADLVEHRLRLLRTDFIRIDTDRYGQHYTLGWDRLGAFLRDSSRRLILVSEIQAVYYRRPTVTEVPRTARDFGVHETWYFSRAALLTAEQAIWMNHPAAVLASENKLLQLQVARAVGLRTPSGILTSDPSEALAFYKSLDRRCVCKPGYAGILANHEQTLAVYAWRLPDNLTLSDLAAVQSSPTFLQELVDKAFDVRVTVVGKEFFACRIWCDDDILDWRSRLDDLNYTPIAIPAAVRDAIEIFMDRLSLSFAAFDFCEDRHGEWYFLEANPAGQWGWLEEATGMPIAATIASWLSNQSR